jgi:hypothetical protein
MAQEVRNLFQSQRLLVYIMLEPQVLWLFVYTSYKQKLLHPNFSYKLKYVLMSKKSI